MSLLGYSSAHAQPLGSLGNFQFGHGFENLYPDPTVLPETLDGQGGGGGGLSNWGSSVWEVGFDNGIPPNTPVVVFQTNPGDNTDNQVTGARLDVTFSAPGQNRNGTSRAGLFDVTAADSFSLAKRTAAGSYGPLFLDDDRTAGSSIWASMLVRVPAGFDFGGQAPSNQTNFEDFGVRWSVHITGPTIADTDPLIDFPGFGIRNGRFFASSNQTNLADTAFGPTVNTGGTYLLVANFAVVNDTVGFAPPFHRGARLWVFENGTAPDYPLCSGIVAPYSTTTGDSRNWSGITAQNVRFVADLSDTTPGAGGYIEMDNIIFGTSCNGVFLFNGEPTSPLRVDLVSLEASSTGIGAPVLLEWETSAEFDNAGFNVYRNNNGSKGAKLNAFPIPAEGSETEGATYSFVDSVPLESGEVRSYFLEDVEFNGATTLNGPVSVGPFTGSPSSVESWSLYQ